MVFKSNLGFHMIYMMRYISADRCMVGYFKMRPKNPKMTTIWLNILICGFNLPRNISQCGIMVPFT